LLASNFDDYQKMVSTYYGTVLAPVNTVAYLSSEEGFVKYTIIY